MTLVMFAHATFYMVISILDLILFIEAWFLDPNPIGFTAGVDKTLPIAIGLLNYVLTDSVVVWRAWVLCREEYMRGLVVSLWFLVFASVSALSTIGIRIALLVVLNPSHASNVLTRVINITQVANLAFSLLTNIVATSIVAIKAWRHKQFFTEMRIRDAKTHTSRVMALLIESGIFYSISLVPTTAPLSIVIDF
ncbi:hypothetical protein EUX98_g5645 [Antrodiella citrinella]|uniref:Uncharacterized protein n=1 Tax=Antrodiella citrinella TaxID=2447956 RepID=A0A4S4MTR3_9APHY|nr:hypothetical protein EUX98_g5645 [Antrodiella citrinella]